MHVLNAIVCYVCVIYTILVSQSKPIFMNRKINIQKNTKTVWTSESRFDTVNSVWIVRTDLICLLNFVTCILLLLVNVFIIHIVAVFLFQIHKTCRYFYSIKHRFTRLYRFGPDFGIQFFLLFFRLTVNLYQFIVILLLISGWLKGNCINWFDTCTCIGIVYRFNCIAWSLSRWFWWNMEPSCRGR